MKISQAKYKDNNEFIIKYQIFWKQKFNYKIKTLILFLPGLNSFAGIFSSKAMKNKLKTIGDYQNELNSLNFKVKTENPKKILLILDFTDE